MEVSVKAKCSFIKNGVSIAPRSIPPLYFLGFPCISFKGALCQFPFTSTESVLALKIRNQIENIQRLKEKFRREILCSPVEKEPDASSDNLVRSALKLIREILANNDLQVEDLCNNLISAGHNYSERLMP